MLRYIELKSGFNDDGPAWIGRVAVSRSGLTIYFDGKALKRARGGGSSGGNHYDLETGKSYWISGVKLDGLDRHWAGKGKITIEAAAVEDYLQTVGRDELDPRCFIVSDALAPADPSKFYDLENEPSEPDAGGTRTRPA